MYTREDLLNKYGDEMILDIHNIGIKKVTRKVLKQFFIGLCVLIDMEREKLVFWDYFRDPEGYKEAPKHLKGISAVQFIKTSSIIVHSLDDLKSIYINIFSCNNLHELTVEVFCKEFFKTTNVNSTTLYRI